MSGTGNPRHLHCAPERPCRGPLTVYSVPVAAPASSASATAVGVGGARTARSATGLAADERREPLTTGEDLQGCPSRIAPVVAI